MSLWSVDDLATCIVTRFYENLYNLWISDINIRARMVRGRSARHRRSLDTGNMISRCDRYALETR